MSMRKNSFCIAIADEVTPKINEGGVRLHIEKQRLQSSAGDSSRESSERQPSEDSRK